MDELTATSYFIKICGVTSIDDALLVRDAGAHALGLIFAESRRRVQVGLARDIVVASEGIGHVGVFRNDDPSFVIDVVRASGVEIAQIHGPLDRSLLEELRRMGVGVIKALSIGAEEIGSFDDRVVDAVLIDGAQPGSGDAHSWNELETFQFAVPVIAAGGLCCENVTDVIERVRPWGVDVATGVESSPGVKDPTLVTKFVQLAKSALSERELT
jgi:phosphoribosylanthranilate isomerase